MVKFRNSYREYILDGNIGNIWKSKHMDGHLVFNVEASYQDMFSKRLNPEILLIYPNMEPLTINGKQYKIKTNDDVVAFRAILEAAVMEDILNDKGDAGKQEGD